MNLPGTSPRSSQPGFIADSGAPFALPGFVPAKTEVESLIERARTHPMGTDFLVEGSLDAVAATFQVHAFTVERAREHLEFDRKQGTIDR